MKRIFEAVIVAALLAVTVQAQTPDQRIAALEAKTAELEKAMLAVMIGLRTEQELTAKLSRAVELLGQISVGQAQNKTQGAPVLATGKPELKSWSGSGAKDTETFTTTKGEWTLRWQAGTGLNVMVYDADTKKLVSLASGAGSDSSVVRAKPGRYYLEILGIGGPWKVSVEE